MHKGGKYSFTYLNFILILIHRNINLIFQNVHFPSKISIFFDYNVE